jgi:hypothetical protein
MNLVIAVAFAPPINELRYFEIILTNKNDIEISLGSWHIWLSFTASHSSRLGGNESDGLSLASGLN